MDRAAQEALRLSAVARLRDGESPSEVAASLGVTYRSILRWAQIAKMAGDDALHARRSTGRPATIDAPKLRALLLNKKPAHYGIDGHVWTVHRVREALATKLGWHASASAVARMLVRFGVVPTRTRPAPVAEHASLLRWVDRRLVELARRPETRFVIIDAQPVPALEMNARGNRRPVIAYTALGSRGRTWFRLYDAPVRQHKTSHFLRDCQPDLGAFSTLFDGRLIGRTSLFRASVTTTRGGIPWCKWSAERARTRITEPADVPHFSARLQAAFEAAVRDGDVLLSNAHAVRATLGWQQPTWA